MSENCLVWEKTPPRIGIGCRTLNILSKFNSQNISSREKTHTVICKDHYNMNIESRILQKENTLKFICAIPSTPILKLWEVSIKDINMKELPSVDFLIPSPLLFPPRQVLTAFDFFFSSIFVNRVSCLYLVFSTCPLSTLFCFFYLQFITFFTEKSQDIVAFLGLLHLY